MKTKQRRCTTFLNTVLLYGMLRYHARQQMKSSQIRQAYDEYRMRLTHLGVTQWLAVGSQGMSTSFRPRIAPHGRRVFATRREVCALLAGSGCAEAAWSSVCNSRRRRFAQAHQQQDASRRYLVGARPCLDGEGGRTSSYARQDSRAKMNTTKLIDAASRHGGAP